MLNLLFAFLLMLVVVFASPALAATPSPVTQSTLKEILQKDPNGQVQKFTNLGKLVTGILNVVFMIGGFLMLFWFAWGVFQYIFAGGSKEGLAKARSRLTWAIMGFVFLVISFAISQYAQNIFPTQNKLKQLTPPPPAVQKVP